MSNFLYFNEIPFEICFPKIGDYLTFLPRSIPTECPDNIHDLNSCKNYTFIDNQFIGICRNAGYKCSKKGKGLSTYLPGKLSNITGIKKKCKENNHNITVWAFDDTKVYITITQLSDKYRKYDPQSFLLFYDKNMIIKNMIKVSNFPIPSSNQLYYGNGIPFYHEKDKLSIIAYKNYCIYLRKNSFDTYTVGASSEILKTPNFISNIFAKTYGGFTNLKKSIKKNLKNKSIKTLRIKSKRNKHNKIRTKKNYI